MRRYSDRLRPDWSICACIERFTGKGKVTWNFPNLPFLVVITCSSISNPLSFRYAVSPPGAYLAHTHRQGLRARAAALTALDNEPLFAG